MKHGARRFAIVAFFLSLVLTESCSSEVEARSSSFLTLARGGFPTGWITRETRSEHFPMAPDGWVRASQVIEPTSWEPTPWPGIFETHVQLPGVGVTPGGTEPNSLTLADSLGHTQALLTRVPFSKQLLDIEALGDGSYTTFGDKLMLVDREGRFVDKQLSFMAWFERVGRYEGRVHLPGVTCDGALLFPGERLDMDLPSRGEGGAVLQFAACAYGSPLGSERATPKLTLRVEVAGQPVHSMDLPRTLLLIPEPVEIPLPSFQGGQVSFRVEGELGVALIQAPILRHLSPPKAPLDDRPDLVIFMADTFRADNLEPWGGDPSLAPTINAFGQNALVFTDAHASGAWTLPSQAALLSGMYAPQIGVISEYTAMPKGFPTLARTLADAGYRTAAVTDGLFVSERYGFDQGFEVFLESSGRPDFEGRTMERVRSVLDADDGRPLLLFVQTYRAHMPYVASAQAMSEHPEIFAEFPDAGQWNSQQLYSQANARLSEFQSQGATPDQLADQVRDSVDKLRRLYLGGVADLDRGFGDFLAELEQRGLDEGYLIFTSDHGEAFGEHNSWAHGNSVYEEQVGIPLILRGPGVEPELRGGLVTLMDITVTLAELAGARPNERWMGHSLFAAEPREGPIFSFEALRSERGVAEYAIYTGDRKVIGGLDGIEPIREVNHAFDLSADPMEVRNLIGEGEWPAELIERYDAELNTATTPVASPKTLDLTEEEKIEFKAMGYLGD